MPDRRSERRANAGRPDKPAKEYGTPTGTQKPTTRKRPKVGPADPETRRRKIEERVQAGKKESRRRRSATKTQAPKPEPKTVGKPGRSTYDTLRDRGKDTDKAVEDTQ